MNLFTHLIAIGDMANASTGAVTTIALSVHTDGQTDGHYSTNISEFRIKLIKTRKKVNFGKPKLVYPCSYKK